ncbi:uncharacterized protein LOC134765768 [Penaeus indicus]|uniref:uncharacterized protein LOC134765768 n=1 Tax=Penaeus indicus TaxID=29960 RepID=UPI00300D27A9
MVSARSKVHRLFPKQEQKPKIAMVIPTKRDNLRRHATALIRQWENGDNNNRNNEPLSGASRTSPSEEPLATPSLLPLGPRPSEPLLSFPSSLTPWPSPLGGTLCCPFPSSPWPSRLGPRPSSSALAPRPRPLAAPASPSPRPSSSALAPHPRPSPPSSPSPRPRRGPAGASNN